MGWIWERYVITANSSSSAKALSQALAETGVGPRRAPDPGVIATRSRAGARHGSPEALTSAHGPLQLSQRTMTRV